MISVRMWQAIVDSRLLEAVSSWLEPMRPSGTLPAEGIQKALFEVLPRVSPLIKARSSLIFRWKLTLKHSKNLT
jgi:hypothetical protein